MQITKQNRKIKLKLKFDNLEVEFIRSVNETMRQFFTAT